MSHQHKEFIIQALTAQRGDDLAQAQFVFSRLSPEQKDTPYPHNNQTPNQILDSLIQRNKKYNDAIEWVRALPN